MQLRRIHGGFSLVELMVALLLGVVLTSGVISVFITSKTSYSLNNAVGQVQEAGRLALGTMQPLVSQAGYTGCGNKLSWHSAKTTNYVTGGLDTNSTAGTDPVYSFTYPVYGFEYTSASTASGSKVVGTSSPTLDGTASHWTPALSNSMLNAFTPAANSDILMMHEGLGNPANLINTFADATNLYEYASTTTPPLSAGDIAVLSSCSAVDIFQITGSTGSPGNTAGGTVQSTGASGTPGNGGNTSGGANWTAADFNNTGGQVGQMQTYIFFVGKGVDGGYSLYEASLTADTGTASKNGQLSSTATPSSVREIVPGVENMQVLYGVNTDGDSEEIPDSYETASQVDAGTCTGVTTCWYAVVSVRIALVVYSDDNSIPKEQAPTAATGIQMLGVAYADSVNYYPAVDRRLHRYFAETISLRNISP